MRRRQQNMFLFSLCCAACALVLLASMRTAEVLSLVYAHNFGTAYADTLRRASSEPLDARGLSTNLLEIFQDHRADAVELYDFQAEQFVRGSTEQLYWYPHFSAVVVLAVAEDCPVPVEGWSDLRENVTVVLPDSCPDREIFFLALARGLSADANLDEAFALLTRLKEEDRLRICNSRRGNQYRLAEKDGGGDVYVLFAHEAEQLIQYGAPLRICMPKEGTLSFTKGLLARKPISFANTLRRDLRAAGYPIAPPAGAAQIHDADALYRELTEANARYRQIIWGHSVFTPIETHERLVILVTILVVTVLWGASLRARVLHHGTRRAVLLLIAMLLLWELTRIAKLLSISVDISLQHFLSYLYYVFRAGLSVALLWIAWASDEYVFDKKMPRWLRAILGLNLLLAALILCNDLHYQFFTFIWNAAAMTLEEHLAWGAYAYWLLWFCEILAALLLLLEKAKRQRVLRPAMALPFLFFALFVVYSVDLYYDPRFAWLELTVVTALFFLFLLELCLRTGLMPSNRFHEAFFSHSHLHMQLVNTEGHTVFSAAAAEQGASNDIRTSRMNIHGGAIIWHEDLSLLHERQRQLALLQDAQERSHTLLRRERRIRGQHLALTLKKQLSEELEAILDSKRPLLRSFREQLMASTDEAELTCLIRRLNLLSSYLKKRCVLFLKGQEDGQIRADELSMAVSETCAYLRPLGLHVGVEWLLTRSIAAEAALALFDLFAELLSRAAEEGAADVLCRFEENEMPEAICMLTCADWIRPWISEWQRRHDLPIEISDLGYALSIRAQGISAAARTPAHGEEAAAWRV